MRYQYLDNEGQTLNARKCQIEEVAMIQDNQTGLIWEAKTFDPNDNRYFQKAMSLEEFTKDYINQLNAMKYGGFDDWRAPSKHELRSLINYRGINPAFDQGVFQTLTSDDYWAGGFYGPRAED